MKKVQLFLLVLAGMVLVSFRQISAWVDYATNDGHYFVQMPGNGIESTKVDTSASGVPLTIHYLTCFPNDSVGYMVDWIDLTSSYPENKPIKQILEESRNGATKFIPAANVITTTTYLVGDQPYIEFSYTSTQYTGRGRIYIINKFQYTIMTIYPLKMGISPDAEVFIRSFKYGDHKHRVAH